MASRREKLEKSEEAYQLLLRDLDKSDLVHSILKLDEVIKEFMIKYKLIGIYSPYELCNILSIDYAQSQAFLDKLESRENVFNRIINYYAGEFNKIQLFECSAKADDSEVISYFLLDASLSDIFISRLFINPDKLKKLYRSV